MHVAATYLPAYLQDIMIKFTLIIVLLLPLSSAFSIRDRISKRLNDRFSVDIFDDVHLPDDMSFLANARNLLDLQRGTNVDVIKYLRGDIKKEIADLIGNPKEDSFDIRRIQQLMVNRYIKEETGDPDVVPGYLYFGNKNFPKILAMLCQVNPFFAGALTFAKEDDSSYLELIATPLNQHQLRTLSICHS